MVKFLHSMSSSPNVEDAMREINNYINYNDESMITNSLEFRNSYTDFEVFRNMLGESNNNYTISAYNPICSQGKFVKLKNIAKRIIRKIVGWYLKDICHQQTCFNANVIRLMNQQVYLMQSLVKENELLKKQIKKYSENQVESKED